MVRKHSLVLAAVLLAAAGGAAPGFGVTLSCTGTTGSDDSNQPIAASIDLTVPSAGVVQITLTNTTAQTFNAGQLLTGVELTFDDVTGTPTLTAGSATARSINNDGSFSDSGTQDLLDFGPAGTTWSIVDASGDTFRLVFNPDAMFGIVGPPTDGSYASANGSIAGNAGHDPYAAESAVFTLSVPGVDSDADLTGLTFLFGTAFQNPLVCEVPPPGGETPPPGGETPPPGGETPPVGVIPEPTSLGLLGLAAAGLLTRCKRR